MSTTAAPQPSTSPSQATAPALLLALPPLDAEQLRAAFSHLRPVLAGLPVLVAYPGHEESIDLPFSTVAVTPPAAIPPARWIHTAAEYLNAYKMMSEYRAPRCLMLASDSWTLAPQNLRAMITAAIENDIDLVLPRYTTSPYDGLVTSTILAPVTRALFSIKVHTPQPLDFAFSLRMAERLAATAQRFTAANQNDALLWPVGEAATAGFNTQEVAMDTRSFPIPEVTDLTQLLTMVAGSLFSDVETRATYWQRARTQATVVGSEPLVFSAEPPKPDVTTMIETFRIGYKNLSEIWSLVLPPNSLLGLKKLSILEEQHFVMPDALWVRIVYDFLLAWRLRTINRAHLLGALTPLYLAWVASYILGERKEAHIEALAAAFDSDKPYLVSRWRWPDRFNP
jgi:hypothetical protein